MVMNGILTTVDRMSYLLDDMEFKYHSIGFTTLKINLKLFRSFVESGASYTQKGPINDEHLLIMRQVSPIEHAHKVKAPTLLQVGSKDLRVPPSQATDYYHRLIANGINARMNVYDDNHPLGNINNEMDNLINSFLWIDQYVNMDIQKHCS